MINGKIFHFIGIGGVSMSALALILHAKGFVCKGSDIEENSAVKNLRANKIEVFLGHKKENVGSADTVIYSSAVDEENCELKLARELNLTVYSRGKLLGILSREYKNVIAVAGAHGKTTTTGMIFSIFQEAGLCPTLHIGGELKNIGNYHIGNEDYFITEACEYYDNFLYLKPDFSAILNVEDEHMDYFKTSGRLLDSFTKFVALSKTCIAPKPFSALKFGEDYSANGITSEGGRYSFSCYRRGEFFAKIKLGVYGECNIHNSLAAIAAADNFGISKEHIKRGLKKFKGVKRRFEEYSARGGGQVIYDYAHHPTEIVEVIKTAKEKTLGRLFVVFQPHTYSRTLKHMEAFVEALSTVDELYIFKTYPAREDESPGGRAEDLYLNLIKRRDNVFFTDNCSQIFKLKKRLSRGDILLVLGAGDLYSKLI